METGRISATAKLHIPPALRLQRAVHLVWQSAPGWTLASLVLLVVQGLLPLLMLYLIKLMVDAVAASPATLDKAVVWREVGLLIGLTGGVAVVGAICRPIAGLVSEAQAQAITDQVHDILHAKSIEVDLEYYENAQYYDTLHRAQQEAPVRPTQIVHGLARVGQNGISLVAIAGLLFAFHWGLAAVLFAAAVPGLLVRVCYANTMYAWQRRSTAAERRASYFNWLLTRDAHAKEIRVFGLGPLFMRQFRDIRTQLRREKLRIATRRSMIEVVVQASATGVVFGAYAFIAYRTVQGALTLGDLVMYYQALQRGQGFLSELLSGVASLYEHNLFLSSLYEFLALKPKVLEPAHPQCVPHPLQRGIVFDQVGFQYPTGTRQVLEDISLTIRPGEHVALVGENGVGKTTLMKLLCRLYDPTQGRITLDGRDLRQFETAALRREISIVFQDYARYHLTARENIWFGNIDLPSSQAPIVNAAIHAGADKVIAGLKYGYETVLGKWFEEGEELSTGEWQKVALARAFLRDAQIIVLDEPTSNLDVQAEYAAIEAFRKLAAGRTAILISHRLSTVRMADRIYVVANGRIVESGTHEELVRRCGTYARLFETQAQYYR